MEPIDRTIAQLLRARRRLDLWLARILVWVVMCWGDVVCGWHWLVVVSPLRHAFRRREWWFEEWVWHAEPYILIG